MPDADVGSLRRHLVDSTATVLRRKRTALVTVREIAAEAGVAIGLLYNHFADKDDLVAAALLERGPAYADAADGPLSRPGEATVAANLAVFATETIAVLRDVLPIILTAPPGLLGRIAAAMHGGSTPHLAARERLTDYLRAEQRLGRVAADADIETAALLLTGALHELAMFAGLSGISTSESDAAAVRRIVGLVARSIT